MERETASGDWGAARPERGAGRGSVNLGRVRSPPQPAPISRSPRPRHPSHSRVPNTRARAGCNRGGGHIIQGCARSLCLLTGAQRPLLLGLGWSPWFGDSGNERPEERADCCGRLYPAVPGAQRAVLRFSSGVTSPCWAPFSSFSLGVLQGARPKGLLLRSVVSPVLTRWVGLSLSIPSFFPSLLPIPPSSWKTLIP